MTPHGVGPVRPGMIISRLPTATHIITVDAFLHWAHIPISVMRLTTITLCLSILGVSARRELALLSAESRAVGRFVGKQELASPLVLPLRVMPATCVQLLEIYCSVAYNRSRIFQGQEFR